MYMDPLYLGVMIVSMILAGWATAKVKGNFARFSRVRAATGMTGAQVAREILRRNNLPDVDVVETRGMLSDHYDPRTRTVRLSPEVYRVPSVAAVAVAAHETGHALQHATRYAPLALRSAAVPIARLGSYAPWLIIIGGFWLNMLSLIYAGVILFAGVVAFQLVTLPVELNASTRARAQLERLRLVSTTDSAGVRKVLNAAAMTYVAAAATAVLQLLYFVSLLGGRRD
ncbi:MAG: zinc metallopeptidase [Deltaproteobacteria bacterium]|nr:zinc metallopeptidase [Deltaproteobacteria bacterium]